MGMDGGVFSGQVSAGVRACGECFLLFVCPRGTCNVVLPVVSCKPRTATWEAVPCQQEVVVVTEQGPSVHGGTKIFRYLHGSVGWYTTYNTLETKRENQKQTGGGQSSSCVVSFFV